MRNVTIRQLQVFIEAAESLSFVRASECLRLTPSAVSFQIKKIESQTGFALFERTGRRVVLTEAGRALLGHARLVLRSLQAADEALNALKGVSGGRIKLGLVSTAKYIVPHIIARFRAIYPGVAVLLREGNRSRVQHMLMSGAVDLAIMGQPEDDADVVAQRFAPHPSVIIAHPGHPLCRARHVQPGELAAEWFVLREDGSGTRSLADRFFRNAGFSPRVAMESSSNEMIKQSVIAGMSLALISQHTISLEVSLGMLVPLAIEDASLMRSWFVVHRHTLPLLPVQTRLRSFLLEQGQPIIEEIGRGHAALSRAAFPSTAPAPPARTGPDRQKVRRGA